MSLRRFRIINLGDRVKITSHGTLIAIGIIDRYMEYDLDGGGYWIVDDDGNEWEVLFHDLFRGDVSLEKL